MTRNLTNLHTISDVTRAARKMSHDTRIALAEIRAMRDFDGEDPTIPTFTTSERSWFRKPLGALALVIALAVGGSAHAAPHADSPAVATAKREVAAAKAHLKDARAHERETSKRERAAKRIAKLQAQIVKLQTAESK